MRKLVLWVLLIILTVLSPLTALAFTGVGYEDIQKSWAKPQIEDLIMAKILHGYRDENGIHVKPDQDINRGEFVTILVNAFELPKGNKNVVFYDISSTAYFATPVEIASSLGIVNGYDDAGFHPNSPIHRDEIATMIVKTLEILKTVDFTHGTNKNFTDVQTSWAKEFIDKASRSGIINGYHDGTFKPGHNATRAEAVTMIYNAINKESTELPENVTLINAVQNHNTEIINAITSKQFDTMLKIADQYETGLYKDWTQFVLGSIDRDLNNGEKVHQIAVRVTPNGTPEAEVISKSDRFAKVKLTGAVYGKVYIQTDSGETIIEGDLNGLYYLRKELGSWRIYGGPQIG